MTDDTAGRKSHESSAAKRVRVSFDAEVLLLDAEVPETLDREALAQAVQNTLGYSGVRVTDVFDWQEENLGR